MEQWKRTFLDKLSEAQSQWAGRFEDALDTAFQPVFDDHKAFLADNGFTLSTPLRESGRRSFKFELAENAYLLMMFRSTGVGELELRAETFVPGNEPVLSKVAARIADIDESWATEQLQSALDSFVDLLAGSTPQPVEQPVEQFVEV